MNIKELSDLVVIRNHIQFLINDRTLVSKDKLRAIDFVKKSIDIKFLEEVSKPAFSANLFSPSLAPTKDPVRPYILDENFLETNNGVVIVNPNKDDQLPLNFDAPKDPVKVDDNLLTSADKPAGVKPTATKSVAKDIAISVDDEKEIAEKISKAKKALKKKVTSKPISFKRDLSEDEGEQDD